jgi:hypothetical protein
MRKEAIYRTDIPPVITVPDTIDTRLGTLKFKDGFPDDATVQKAYDNLDCERAVQAMLTAMRAASLAAMRRPVAALVPIIWGLQDDPINFSSSVISSSLVN